MVTAVDSGSRTIVDVTYSATVGDAVAPAITAKSQADVDKAFTDAIAMASGDGQWEAGGAKATVAASALFVVPDGITPSYQVSSANTAVVGAVVEGMDMVALTPLMAGSARITVTAIDVAGGTNVSATYDATVMKAAAEPAIAAKSQAEVNTVFMEAGADDLVVDGPAVMVDMSKLFTISADAEPTYSTMSDMPAVLAASGSGMMLTLKPMSAGGAMVMVTAVDSGSRTIVDVTYSATVGDAVAPAITAKSQADVDKAFMDAIAMASGDGQWEAGGAKATVAASALFVVPDGITPSYQVSSASTAVVGAAIEGMDMVALTPLMVGSARITVTAVDVAGGTNVSATYDATVMEAGPVPAVPAVVAKSQAEVDMVFMDAGAGDLMVVWTGRDGRHEQAVHDIRRRRAHVFGSVGHAGDPRGEFHRDDADAYAHVRRGWHDHGDGDGQRQQHHRECHVHGDGRRRRGAGHHREVAGGRGQGVHGRHRDGVRRWTVGGRRRQGDRRRERPVRGAGRHHAQLSGELGQYRGRRRRHRGDGHGGAHATDGRKRADHGDGNRCGGRHQRVCHLRRHGHGGGGGALGSRGCCEVAGRGGHGVHGRGCRRPHDGWTGRDGRHEQAVHDIRRRRAHVFGLCRTCRPSSRRAAAG